jgi:hypothetical protein
MSRMPDENGARPQESTSSAGDSSRAAGGALPPPSRIPHVTLSGGLLSGGDVLRIRDKRLPTPEKIEVGAQVELQDGTHAEVVKVRGKRLTEFGILAGSLKVKLPDGRVVSTPSRDVARVLVPASQV